MKTANRYSFLFLFIFLAASYSTDALYRKIKKHPDTVRGEKAYAAGAYDRALEHFQKAIEAGETRGEPYFFTGAIMEYRRKYSEATPWYAAALEHKLTPELQKAALWKLVLLYRNERNYIEMLAYIERLEALGVTHKNIEKFKEEATGALTPEKMEAYTLKKEADTLIKTYAKEHPRANFWDQSQNSENINRVIYNYERAAYLDKDLFHLNWKLAGFYEKQRDYSKAFETYRRILRKKKSARALYRAGVVLKKEGRFNDSLQYFDQTLDEASNESQLRYFTLINISQVLFAKERFQEGQKHAAGAVKMEALKEIQAPPFQMAQLMHCLHSVALYQQEEPSTEASGKVASCDKSLTRKNQKKVPAPLLPLYRYGQWSYGLLIKKDSKINPKESIRLVTEILIPPKMRNAAGVTNRQIVPLDCDAIKNNSTSSWRCLPNWMYGKIPRLSLYLHETQSWHTLYTVLSLYKERFLQESYHVQMGEVSFELKKYESAINSYRQIKERNLKEEQNFLLALAAESKWSELQSEALSYYKSRSFSQYQERKLLVEFIRQEKIVDQVPESEIQSEFKMIFDAPGSDREIIEPESSPEESAPGSAQNPETDENRQPPGEAAGDQPASAPEESPGAASENEGRLGQTPGDTHSSENPASNTAGENSTDPGVSESKP